jgi:predicted RNase H-like HicB family nuclease
MLKSYAIITFWSPADAAWVADAPDLKSCSAFGSTPEAAVAELRIAMEAWLGVAKEKGMKLPMPQFNQPLRAAEYSHRAKLV